MIARAEEVLDVFPSAKISAKARVADLSVAARQIVEIAKSLVRPPRLWILDEPTSSLSEAERVQLFTVVRQAAAAGAAVLYTTHRMDEIRAMVDRVLVLRDGELVMDRPMTAVEETDIVQAMLGKRADRIYPVIAAPADTTPKVLKVEDLAVKGLKGSVSLDVRQGEIVGVAGLVGSGRTELLEGIFGARPATGQVRIRGVEVPRNRPGESVKHGLVLIPEDRQKSGLFLGMSITDNVTITRLGVGGKVVRNDTRRQQQAQDVANRTALRYQSLGAPVRRLSGGNQQKALIGRAMAGHVAVLLLDEPSRGVDVGARAEIYGVIQGLVDAGMAVVMVSSDLDEVANLAHRVLVMRDRQVVGEVPGRREETKETILRLALNYAATDRET
jgi:ribose transport system ATP-binding protein